MQERFGVLMCNHNRGKFLEEAIESIIKQSYKNWKLYLLDDGSTDNSKKILEKYKNHPKINIVENQTNKGVGFCKKLLLAISNENFVGFVDSDDVLEPTALEECIKIHQIKTNASLVYTNHWICDEKLNLIKKGDSRKIPKDESHATFFGISLFASFNRKYLNQIQGIRENLPKAVDQDLYLQLEEVGAVVFIDKCLYKYRHNNNSISLNKNYKEAGKYRIQLLREAKERRKNTNIPYPSDLWIDFRERQLQNPNPFSLFLPKSKKHLLEILNFIFYQIKVRTKQVLFGLNFRTANQM